ncbi:MAG: family 43 glycosylhydrolase [Nibricoccus sp.]
MWAPDAAHANGRYYLYFPARDKAGVFRIGVATSNSPAGPFKAEPQPMDNAFSIDPTAYRDDDGIHYLYFGGISGGQLDKWPGNRYSPDTKPLAPDQPAAAPRVAKLRPDMLGLVEEPREIQILDESGKPLLSGDENRRFFEDAGVYASASGFRCAVYFTVTRKRRTPSVIFRTRSSSAGKSGLLVKF